MTKTPAVETSNRTLTRDLCIRPTAIYNEFYNPEAPMPDNIPAGYSPYVFGQPLFDDRPVALDKIPNG